MGLLMGVLVISSQSLWIDEANSAVKAIVPTWSEFVAKMSVERGSDLQMPGYMGALWAWAKIFGYTEYALRALNIPFFVGALVFVFFNLRASLRMRIFFILLSCTSAFLWFYLDEARPYIFEFFGATLAMTGLYNMAISQFGHLCIGDALAVLIGLIVLLAASLSTIFFVALLGMSFLLLLFRLESCRMIVRNRVLTMTFLLACLAGVALASYYYWTLKVGAKASSVGKTTPISILFCFYELAGCIGMGPGRNDLRNNPVGSLRSFAIPLAIYASIFVAFVVTSFSIALPKIRQLPRSLWFLVIAVATAVLMVFALGLIADFRVVGRHLMPAFPFLVLALSRSADLTFSRRHFKGMLLVGLVLIAGLVSSLEIRFEQRHAKDDYRDAALTALRTLHQGGAVWWAADKAGAEYYGLSSGVPNKAGASDPKVAVNIIGIPEIEMEAIHPPTVVILSKEDIYDPRGSLLSWIKEHHYVIAQQFPSFKVYVAP